MSKDVAALLSFFRTGQVTDTRLLDRTLLRLFEDGASASTDDLKGLLSYGANVNARNTRRNTPLMLAARAGDLGSVKFLVSQENAKIDLRGSWSCTALMFAARGSHLGIVEYLIDAGADPTLRGNGRYNLTAGGVAAWFGSRGKESLNKQIETTVNTAIGKWHEFRTMLRSEAALRKRSTV